MAPSTASLLCLALLCDGVLSITVPDPIKFVNSGVTTILCSIVGVLLVLFLYQYWPRVLLALTGDDRIHADPNNCIWWTCFRCCGTCSGNWTRHFTKCFSCCPCCPKWLPGNNLVRLFGQAVGLVPVPVEIKSIVVGDLPFDGSGDFYLSIECSTNPPMVTSMAEDKNPKVVHFPETLTMKLRRSRIEPRVRMVVKELNVVGHEELCELYLSPLSVLDWSDDQPQDRIKRFQMTVLRNEMERSTPPWVSMEFSCPTEARHLEMINQQPRNTVRTLDATGSTWKDWRMNDFKTTYVLVDGTGNPVDEPNEEQLQELESLRRWLLRVFRFFNCIIYLLVFSWVCVRTYVWSCYRQFRFVTMVKLLIESGATAVHDTQLAFPMSLNHLKDVVKYCHHQVRGTGIDTGKIPCRPNYEQTLMVCNNVSEIIWPQPRPLAGHCSIQTWTGLDAKGLPCIKGVCAFRSFCIEWDIPIIIILACLMGSTLLCHCWGEMCLRRRRNRQLKQETLSKKVFKEKMTQQGRR